MAAPNLFDNPISFVKPCLVCQKEVGSERNEAMDIKGKLHIWYTPISLYWTDEGVFCSPECGLIFYQGKNPNP